MSKKIILINYIVLGIFFVLNILASVYLITNSKTEIIFNNNILKTVEIKVTDNQITWGYATGCFVDSNGTILTNKHVVYNSITEANYDLIQVRLANVDEWVDAEVLKVSENDDLALIKIDKQNTQYFNLQLNLNNGETIYTIGNPNGFGLSFVSGVVSSNLRNIIYNDQTIPSIQTSFVINEGNSGGPVFNSSGELVGLISFRLKDNNGDVIQGVSFAVPASIINNFLAD